MIPRALRVLGLVAISTALLASRVDAQTPSPTSTPAAGTIAATVSGRVTSGTAGEAVPDGLVVRMIALDGAKVSTAAQTTTRNGTFEVQFAATPGQTYVPHVVHQAIDYFADKVSFTAGAPRAQRDFLVYGTTRETGQLVITSTSMTLVAIDREGHQLGFVREDVVANPSDRVYVGDVGGVTLHLPVPERTIEAAGEGDPDAFVFQRGVLTAAVPIRPGVPTTIVTRYLVGYDAAADTYQLRVTTALPAEQVKVRVPAGYARMRPITGLAGGIEHAPDERSSSGARGEVLNVVRSTGRIQPGGGVLVDLVGLSGHLQSNPLTDLNGALAGSAVALAILGGSALASLRSPRRG